MKYVFAIFFILFPAGSFASLQECVTLFYSREPSAFESCLSLAENGDVEAQKITGDMYYWGWGDKAPKDYGKAVSWYKKAAVKGQVEAKYNLGVLYENGKGVTIDFEKAFKWYLSAGNDGHAGAQLNVGNMYSKGAGVSQNYREAARWYIRAAEQGEMTAQYNIANRYVKGQGVETDAIEAYKWYTIAADRGMEEAMSNRKIIKPSMTKEQILQAENEAKSWIPEIENLK